MREACSSARCRKCVHRQTVTLSVAIGRCWRRLRPLALGQQAEPCMTALLPAPSSRGQEMASGACAASHRGRRARFCAQKAAVTPISAARRR